MLLQTLSAARTRGPVAARACRCHGACHFSVDGGFVGAFFAHVVGPDYLNALALLAALEAELQEWILRYRGAPIRRQHHLALPGGADLLDEVCGYRLAGAVLALA